MGRDASALDEEGLVLFPRVWQVACVYRFATGEGGRRRRSGIHPGQGVRKRICLERARCWPRLPLRGSGEHAQECGRQAFSVFGAFCSSEMTREAELRIDRDAW